MEMITPCINRYAHCYGTAFAVPLGKVEKSFVSTSHWLLPPDGTVAQCRSVGT